MDGLGRVESEFEWDGERDDNHNLSLTIIITIGE